MALQTEDRGNLVVEALNSVGYDDRLIRRNFPAWTVGGVVRYDAVAFGRLAPQDMTTATILAKIGNADRTIEEALDGAVSLACPAALVALEHEIQLWSVSGSNRHERVFAAGYDRLSELGSRYGEALSPKGLLGAKSQGRQLTLFPVDVELLASARASTATRLNSLVLEAMDVALGSIKRTETRPKDSAEEEPHLKARLSLAAELVVGVVAALVVRDKFDIEASDPHEILVEARNRFPGYFKLQEHSNARSSLITDLFQMLGEGINYAGLDSVVVSDVYEGALVSEADRLRLGIYYTPSWLADAVARTVPFEAIPPAALTVMDPACGSGSFLLAAHNRMMALMPFDWPLDTRHHFARSHLMGFDSDSFAVEIAKLALLLCAMPAGNSWDVQQRDVLKQGIPPQTRPSVILSNPPWKNTRSIEGKRHELADDFLNTALATVNPGGYIGVILPAAWLAGGTSRAARRQLAERTRIFEVWRLTNETFGRSSLAPCVVFAQVKPPQGQQPFVYRRILKRKGSLERFHSEAIADEQYLSETSGATDDLLLRGPLSDPRLSLPSRCLADIATIKSGPVPRPPVSERGAAGGNSFWLRSATDLLPFQEVPMRVLVPVEYPKEFHRAAYEDPLLGLKKLLVSAKRSAENPWRIKVGVDLLGVIPRETLQMVVPMDPHDEDDLYSILAVLSSALASCWVDALAPKMVIEPEVLGSLPIPSGNAWSQFSTLGRRLAAAAAANDDSVHAVLEDIERTTVTAYELPRRTAFAIRQHMAGFPAPEGVARFEWQPTPCTGPRRETDVAYMKAARRTVGAVLDIKDGRLKLWLPGVTGDEGDWVSLPPRLPGWLCVPGRTFEAVLVDGDLESGRFEYQVGSYLEDIDELRPGASAGAAWLSPP